MQILLRGRVDGGQHLVKVDVWLEESQVDLGLLEMIGGGTVPCS